MADEDPVLSSDNSTESVQPAAAPAARLASNTLILLGVLVVVGGILLFRLRNSDTQPWDESQPLAVLVRGTSVNTTAQAVGAITASPVAGGSSDAPAAPPKGAAAPAGAPTPTPIVIRAPTPTPINSPIRMVIPKIGVNAPVVEAGVDRNGVIESADYAVAHYAYSANPGERGNSVLTAHNDIKGEIFRYLDRLEAGDEITVSLPGAKYTYRVRGKKVVLPSEMSVVAATKEPVMTLISCTPYLVDTHRLVVTADLVGEPR